MVFYKSGRWSICSWVLSAKKGFEEIEFSDKFNACTAFIKKEIESIRTN